MSGYTYANKKRPAAGVPNFAASQPTAEELRAGTAAPTNEQLGHRVDLPDAMREKMENAFGAYLTAVKLYESEAVGDAGVEAVTQGSNIAFAPGMLDFTSYGGQALLGHEMSHVVSQARGEVTGSGLLNDHALEARADREGAMAASGQQIAMPAEAMSPVTAAAASGPMQCRGKKESNQMIDRLHAIGGGMYAGADISDTDRDYYNQSVKSLSKRERTMIGKRARKSMRDQYDMYKDLRSRGGSDSSVQRELAASYQDADMSIYSRMISDFASSNGYNGDQTDAEFASMNSLLSKKDRQKNEELDDFMPGPQSFAGDAAYQKMDRSRKNGLKSMYDLVKRG